MGSFNNSWMGKNSLSSEWVRRSSSLEVRLVARNCSSVLDIVSGSIVIDVFDIDVFDMELDCCH